MRHLDRFCKNGNNAKRDDDDPPRKNEQIMLTSIKNVRQKMSVASLTKFRYTEQWTLLIL